MTKLFRVYLEKPELAGVALLILLTALFELVREALSCRPTTCVEYSGCSRKSASFRSV